MICVQQVCVNFKRSLTFTAFIGVFSKQHETGKRVTHRENSQCETQRHLYVKNKGDNTQRLMTFRIQLVHGEL